MDKRFPSFFKQVESVIDPNKIIDSPFHIGDIVQLKAASQAYDEKFPYMIIIEAVKEKIDDAVHLKYHCVWFKRGKIWEFKHSWLTSVTLTGFLTKNEKKVSSETKIGSIVFLSNLNKELAKIKDEKGNEKEVASRFCPPALTIIGFAPSKNQAPTVDSNSNVIREVPSLLAKCLYFNPISNKYSEILLPIEALLVI